MNEWYYSAEGHQRGPVSMDELRQRAASGQLHPAKDLVWNSSMTDWLPAGQVPGLFDSPAAPAAFGYNPYAPPQAAHLSAPLPPGALPDIPFGSQPLDALACVSRAFTLTNRNLLPVVGIGVVYLLVVLALSVVVGMVQGNFPFLFTGGAPRQTGLLAAVAGLLNNVASIFLYLGLTRVALNIVSGEPVSVAQLFGEGSRLLRAVGASILFGIMIVVGLILLIVPGIYLALRFSYFMAGIVDRDLGVIDSLKYSYDLTSNSTLSLLLLWIITFLIVIGGMILLGVGLFYAVPVATLSMMTAFRWMQYGSSAVQDETGSETPALRGRTLR